MRYLSLFSGVEAATVGWKSLGWTCVGVSEIEPVPCAVLAHHYPNVPNLGDVTKITEADIQALGRLDLIVFGSPCQDLSQAGKREGLDGERSGLFFAAMRIVRWAKQHSGLRWALWENVPGAFSSSDGRDFARVVDEMVGVPNITPPPGGWGTEGAAVGQQGLLEWATLDAQWFGVAQRRRRVFAVADFGNWSGRPPVLLEPESVRGDSGPSRTTWRQRTGGITNSFGMGGEAWLSGKTSYSHQTANPAICAENQSAPSAKNTTVTSHALAPLKTTSTNTARLTENSKPEQSTDLAFRLLAFGKYSDDDTASNMQARDYKDVTDIVVTVFVKATNPRHANDAPRFEQTEVSATLNCFDERHFNPPKHIAVIQSPELAYRVRRLTPVEGERLQGFPDHYTSVTYKGKPNSDSSRYMAIGNSMCAKVMRWIGYQLDFVHYNF